MRNRRRPPPQPNLPSLPGTVAFSAIKRAPIVSDSGSELGVLDDVVVDGSGRIVQLVIGRGGVLGIGETRHRLETRALPPMADGKVRLPGQTPETIAALPKYEEAEPTQTAAATNPKFAPVSGANQMAPQSATTDIPVAPGTTTGQAVAPGSQATQTPSTPDTTGATRATPVMEESAARPGTGMAPQEGTGTSPTQIAPNAKSAEGNAGGAQPGLTAGYARDQNATQPMQHGAVDAAATPPAGADSASKGEPLARQQQSVGGGSPGATSSASARDSAHWLVGRIIGPEIRGLETGVSVKDMRFASSADHVEAVILSKGIGKDFGRGNRLRSPEYRRDARAAPTCSECFRDGPSDRNPERAGGNQPIAWRGARVGAEYA